MRYIVQTNATGRMMPEAAFRVFGDAVGFFGMCAYEPPVVVELVEIETGKVFDLDTLTEDEIDHLSDLDCQADELMAAA